MARLVFLLLLVAVPSSAGPITWQASGTLTFVNDPLDLWGFGAGTPWTLSITFDPRAVGTSLAPSPAYQNCSGYSTGPMVLTLGGATYSRPSGNVYTNFQFPEQGCLLDSQQQDAGLISFVATGPWTEEPGTDSLNWPPHFLAASYYDLLATDGGLPTVPAIDPAGGLFDGLRYDGDASRMKAQFTSNFAPVALTQPAAVPEPATLTMLGAGLAALAARRRRRNSERR